MAATNVSASGGLDLLQLSNFIDQLVQRHKAAKYLGGAPVGQEATAPGAAAANPFVQAALQSLAQARSGEATAAETRSATGIQEASARNLGGMSPQAFTAKEGQRQFNEGFPLQQRATAVAEAQAGTQAKNAETLAAQQRSEEQANAMKALSEVIQFGNQGPIATMLSKIVPGMNLTGPLGGLSNYFKQMQIDQQKILDEAFAKEKTSRERTAAPPPVERTTPKFQQAPGAFPTPYGMGGGHLGAIAPSQPERRSTTGEMQRRLQEINAQIARMTEKGGPQPKEVQDQLDVLIKNRTQIEQFLRTLGVQ